MTFLNLRRLGVGTKRRRPGAGVSDVEDAKVTVTGTRAARR